MQVGGYYAVEPKTDCPHILETNFPDSLKNITSGEAKVMLSSSCAKCTEDEENWLCLECGELQCSRYKNGHMKEHNELSSHPLAISFSDLSCWCYSCNAYIVSRRLTELHAMLYLAKFNQLPPNFSSRLELPNTKSTSAYPPPTPIHNELPDEIDSPNAKGHLKKESLQEYQDEPDVLEAKIDELALLFKESNQIVSFTGAGISTSSNIPDYRSPTGIWTLRDRGLEPESFDITKAQPTITHKALKSFCDIPEKTHFVISTNVDGLHMKSGLDDDSYVELHGNIYKEECNVCEKVETKDKPVSRCEINTNIDEITIKNEKDRVLRHFTGRKCDCGGYFCDTIIHFGEDLTPRRIQLAVNKAHEANLSLVLGTSMRVAPANRLPELAFKNDGKLVIVNLQNTPFDDCASIRIWAPTDIVMTKLCSRLGIELE